jgi:hypothetical protein
MKKGVKEIIVKKSLVSVIFSEFKAFADEKLRRAIDEMSDCVTVAMSTAPAIEFIRTDENNEQMLLKVRQFLALTV